MTVVPHNDPDDPGYEEWKEFVVETLLGIADGVLSGDIIVHEVGQHLSLETACCAAGLPVRQDYDGQVELEVKLYDRRLDRRGSIL